MSNPEGINQYSGGGKSSPDKVASRMAKGQEGKMSPIDKSEKTLAKRWGDVTKAKASGNADKISRASARYNRAANVTEAAGRNLKAYQRANPIPRGGGPVRPDTAPLLRKHQMRF